MTNVERFDKEIGLDQESAASWRKRWEAELKDKEQEECPHDELDHGYCLDCGKDCFDDVVAAAEFRSDCLEDR